MNFSFPSLERIALLKIASVLWSKNNSRDCRRFWYERFTVEKAQGLEIPLSLRKKLQEVIQFVDSEMRSWGHRHSIYLSSVPANVSVELCWTRPGTIDERNIAKSLVRCKEIDIFGRYLLSCIFCLEQDISTLMKRLNGEDSWGIVKSEKCDFSFPYWTFKMDPNLMYFSDNMCLALERRTPNLSNWFSLQEAVAAKNSFLTEYLWRKFSTPMKRDYLHSYFKGFGIAQNERVIVPTKRDADVFYVLLADEDEQFQNCLLREYTFAFLNHLVYWPYHKFFMHFAKHSYDYLSHHELLELLDNVFFLQNIYVYTDLFEVFWEHTPEHRKQLVLQDALDYRFYAKLFGNKKLK